MSSTTLSYVHGTSSAPLAGQTIGESLARTVAAHGDDLALVSRHQGVRLTYAELAAEVEKVALALLTLGVRKGDRVGIWSPNCAEWAYTQYATARVGAILVNVNPSYRSHELAYALGQSGVSLLVTGTEFKGADYLATIAEVRDQLPGLSRVVVLGDRRAGGPEDLTWAELVANGDCVNPDVLAEREATLDFDDPINIQYTSGTTGSPKGATLTHHNILNNGAGLAGLLGYTSSDKVCIPVPLYHCFGMVMGNLACTSVGATMVYPAPAFDPGATLAAIAEERCTSVYGVPTMFIAELEHPSFAELDFSSLRTGIMAGAPCPVEVMKRVTTDMHVPEVTIAYGMTETSPVSFLARRDDPIERRVSTVGTVMPHVEAKVVDPATGRTVPRGTSGEVCTRGYPVMLGYWDNAEATAKAVDPAGWMHTGDLGVIDDEGYLNIVGRIKDLVIRGGENVYPREVEEVLYQHPAVADAQVIGVPDARMGEEVMAWVVLKEGRTATEEDLRAFARERLARYKVPRYVKFVDTFPMTVTGKVQKFLMREAATEELGLASAAAVRTA